MTRQEYRAAIWDGRELIAEKTTYAHNSGIRASEALAREYARARGIILHGGQPQREGTVYQRVWRGPGDLQICATVERVTR